MGGGFANRVCIEESCRWNISIRNSALNWYLGGNSGCALSLVVVPFPKSILCKKRVDS